MHEIKDTVRSTVHIGFDGRVHKTFRGTDADKRFAREVEVLKYLEACGCDFVPQVIESDEKTLYLVTTNCGQPADAISDEKAATLFKELRDDYGVAHGDEFSRNITYDPKRGRFCVIDFELATIVEPHEVPEGGGGRGKTLRWSGESRSGSRKEENDDTFVIFACKDEKGERMQDSGTGTLVGQDIVCAVSDGMGGGQAGHLASRLILIKLSRFIPRTLIGAARAPDDYFLSCLAYAVEQVHRELNRQGAEDAAMTGMGATLSLAWFSPGRIHCAHIGDSRIYRYRKGKLEQLTRDHTFAHAQLRRGEISERLFRTHPRRAALCEVLGGQHATAMPDLFTEKSEPGDRYLLCTDGLIDGLWDWKIEEAFAAGGSVDDVREHLIEGAVSLAGVDDTSLVVAELA